MKSLLRQRTRSTQTTYPIASLEEKLREQDKKIKYLERELESLKRVTPSLGFSVDKNSIPTPGLDNISPYPEVSPYFRQRIIFSSQDFDNDPKILQQLNTKIPLDTANIEEIDKLPATHHHLTITPEPPPLSAKFVSKNPRKKPLLPMNSKSSIVRSSKTTLKSKTKLPKNNSIICYFDSIFS